MGGTRFVGKPLVKGLLEQGHQITLFTRGRNALPKGVENIVGDRNVDEDLQRLQGRTFDVIIDSSGRQLEDTRKVLLITKNPKYRFLYVSSAGVYANIDQWPLDEETPTDPSSRHFGKVETENWLLEEGIPFTSFRPTYIYGPGNYNPIERWFFDRITNNRTIPLPGDGNTITQLGHVVDLARAMIKSLEVEISVNRIYNCSGNRGVTFRGLIKKAAIACGKDPQELLFKSFDIENLDPKARKAFPLRLTHFLTDTTRVQRELNWVPEFDLDLGLKDSYVNDYLINPGNKPDFSSDEALIGI